MIHPLYDSQAYGLTVLDPDFYGEMVPHDAKLLPCLPCCEHAKDKVSDGLAGVCECVSVRECACVCVCVCV